MGMRVYASRGLWLIAVAWACGAVWADTESPVQVVADTSSRIIQALHEHREELRSNPRKVYELIDQIAVPRFDTEVISREVLGRYWRQATPDQRRRFMEAFRTYVINSYAKALLRYEDETVKVEPLRPGDRQGDRAVVHSVIQGSSGSPIHVDYRLFERNGQWKVYDVVVDGVSMVISYRDSFADKIEKAGLDALISDLLHHNAEFKLQPKAGKDG